MVPLLRKVADGLLFTSVFIGACALLMAGHTQLRFAGHLNTDLLGFIFTGTLCSYNFHWLLTPALYGHSPKAAWSVRHRKLHAALFGASLLAAAWFGWRLLPHWPWLLLTAFITFLYSAPKIPSKPFGLLKRIAVGKTAFLALAWTHIPFMLPLLVAGTEWSTATYLFVFNRFYLIYPICILFDYRDRAADRAEGIRSLVTQLPESGVHRLFAGSLAVFFASGAALPLYGFTVTETALLLLPGLLLGGLWRTAQRRRSDYFYYCALDGLMALSSGLWLIL
ncbi:UbiA family prenyltransferase [Flaviaesturariibacter amylovorans]|uniref:UbiA prenyltransferase family protein n=1 Tax=Flaviaesturariibacter amylovorans TaxID=1084520 RepID=A0ABP8H1F5_9BACT